MNSLDLAVHRQEFLIHMLLALTGLTRHPVALSDRLQRQEKLQRSEVQKPQRKMLRKIIGSKRFHSTSEDESRMT